jgi:hypothetical protein
MRISTSLLIIALLALRPLAAAAQPPLSPDAEAAAFKQLAAGIPLGSRVVVRTKEGRRLRATLMAVEDERIVIKRDSRVPEPAVEVAFADLARLERESKGGFSFVKALGIGLAAGAGAILTLFAIAVSLDD